MPLIVGAAELKLFSKVSKFASSDGGKAHEHRARLNAYACVGGLCDPKACEILNQSLTS